MRVFFLTFFLVSNNLLWDPLFPRMHRTYVQWHLEAPPSTVGKTQPRVRFPFTKSVLWLCNYCYVAAVSCKLNINEGSMTWRINGLIALNWIYSESCENWASVQGQERYTYKKMEISTVRGLQKIWPREWQNSLFKKGGDTEMGKGIACGNHMKAWVVSLLNLWQQQNKQANK